MEIITDIEKLQDRCDEINIGKENGYMRKIISDLKSTMREKDLASLSAPQIGYDKRIFCINFDGDIKSFINPVIAHAEGLSLVRESCTSLPDRHFLRPRNTKISVMYQTPLQKPESRILTGMAAYVFQHELDHLDGILLTDVAMELAEGYDDLSEEEKTQLINEYKDSLDIKRDEVNAEIEKDEYAKRLMTSIDYMTAVEKGEVELEHANSTT